jgi:hypothetical protein
VKIVSEVKTGQEGFQMPRVPILMASILLFSLILVTGCSTTPQVSSEPQISSITEITPSGEVDFPPSVAASSPAVPTDPTPGPPEADSDSDLSETNRKWAYVAEFIDWASANGKTIKNFPAIITGSVVGPNNKVEVMFNRVKLTDDWQSEESLWANKNEKREVIFLNWTDTILVDPQHGHLRTIEAEWLPTYIDENSYWAPLFTFYYVTISGETTYLLVQSLEPYGSADNPWEER